MILASRCERCGQPVAPFKSRAGDNESDCPHDRGYVQYYSGSRGEFLLAAVTGGSRVELGAFLAEYTGSLKGGLPDGRGIQVVGRREALNESAVDTFRIGPDCSYVVFERYKGPFHGGVREGFAALVKKDGGFYLGPFRHGLENGVGCLIRGAYEEYHGGFVDGEPHGNGVLTREEDWLGRALRGAELSDSSGSIRHDKETVFHCGVELPALRLEALESLASAPEPEEMSDVCSAVFNSVRELNDRGLYEEAEPLLRRIARLAERFNFDGNHDSGFTVSRCLDGLAEHLLFRGNRAEAEAVYRRAIELAHPCDTKWAKKYSLQSLVLLLIEDSRFAEAEPFLRELVEIASADLKDDRSPEGEDDGDQDDGDFWDAERPSNDYEDPQRH